MVTTRLRLLSLLTAASRRLRCLFEHGRAERFGGRRRLGCRQRLRRDRDGRRCDGSPDPRCRRRQVQRRDGPHRPAQRQRLEPGPLRGPPVRLRERAGRARRLHRARARGCRLGAGLPQPVAQGLQLHHRHLVRLHGPDGDGGRGIPRHHVPAPDRLQVERQELRQLLRRDGGLQVPRRDARRIARQEGRQSRRSATWPRSRSRRSCASATRSCSASSRPAPSARWTSASSTPGTTRSRSGTPPPRCSTPARTSCSPAPTRRPSPTSRRRRASGRSPTTTPARARSSAA